MLSLEQKWELVKQYVKDRDYDIMEYPITSNGAEINDNIKNFEKEINSFVEEVYA